VEKKSSAAQVRTTGEHSTDLFARGVALFNSRHFFEAHEAWEEIWLHTERPEKTFLQGLIQVTAAFHHHSRKNLAGTESLLRAGLEKLEAFPAHHRQLRIDRLRASVRRWLATIARGNHARRPPLPRLLKVTRN
jgi:predicted metal-dependent hydrolase